MSDEHALVLKTCLEDVYYFIDRFKQRAAGPNGDKWSAPLERLHELKGRIEHLLEDMAKAPKAPERAPEPRGQGTMTEVLLTPGIELLERQLTLRMDELEKKILGAIASDPARPRLDEVDANVRKVLDQMNQRFAKLNLTVSTLLDTLMTLPRSLESGFHSTEDKLLELGVGLDKNRDALKSLLDERFKPLMALSEPIAGIERRLAADGDRAAALADRQAEATQIAALAAGLDRLAAQLQELRTETGRDRDRLSGGLGQASHTLDELGRSAAGLRGTFDSFFQAVGALASPAAAPAMGAPQSSSPPAPRLRSNTAVVDPFDNEQTATAKMAQTVREAQHQAAQIRAASDETASAPPRPAPDAFAAAADTVYFPPESTRPPSPAPSPAKQPAPPPPRTNSPSRPPGPRAADPASPFSLLASGSLPRIADTIDVEEIGHKTQVLGFQEAERLGLARMANDVVGDEEDLEDLDISAEPDSTPRLDETFKFNLDDVEFDS